MPPLHPLSGNPFLLGKAGVSLSPWLCFLSLGAVISWDPSSPPGLVHFSFVLTHILVMGPHPPLSTGRAVTRSCWLSKSLYVLLGFTVGTKPVCHSAVQQFLEFHLMGRRSWILFLPETLLLSGAQVLPACLLVSSASWPPDLSSRTPGSDSCTLLTVTVRSLSLWTSVPCAAGQCLLLLSSGPACPFHPVAGC